MKKARHSEEKIIAAVRQMEGGRKSSDVAREMGVRAASYLRETGVSHQVYNRVRMEL